MDPDSENEFASSAEGAQGGFVEELVLLLRENRKWWLTPIVLVLSVITVLFVIAAVAPAAAPFIYTLF